MSTDEFERRVLLPLCVLGAIALVLMIGCGVMR